MPPQTLGRRVEKLEEHVMNLQKLPARMDALCVQMSQLRDDLGAKISAIEKTLRKEILSSEERILAQVRTLHEDVVSRLSLIQEGRPKRRR